MQNVMRVQKKNVNVTKIFGYKNYNLDRNNMYMIKILN